MGCGCLSKMDNSELVNLCRKRKKLIKAAKDFRYALASAHVVYFQSFVNVGNSLYLLVEEGVVTSVEEPLTIDSDHQSTGKVSSHLDFSSLESDSDLDSLTDYMHEGSDLSEPSSKDVYNVHKLSEDMACGIYEQPPVVDPTAWWFPTNKVTQYPPQCGNGVSYGGHTSFPPNDPMFFPYGEVEPLGGPMTFSSINPRFSQYGNGVSFGGSTNYPPINLNFYRQRNGVPFGGHINLPHTNLKFYPNEGGVSFDDPTNLLPNNRRFPLNENVIITGSPMNILYNNFRSVQHGMEADLHPHDFTFPQYETGVSHGGAMNFLPNDPYHITRQSPPAPEVSTWDYLNPFTVIDDTFSSYYFDGSHETDFSGTGSNLREVREMEGIPDLESEEEDGLVEEEQHGIETEENNRGRIDDGSTEAVPLEGGPGGGPSKAVPLKGSSGEGPSKAVPLKGSSGEGPSKAVPLKGSSGEGPSEKIPNNKGADAVLAQEGPESNEKDNKCNSSKLGCLEEEVHYRRRETVAIQETVKQDAVSSMQVTSTTSDTHGSKDLKEVVMEIRDAFKTAFDYGEDVSVALETGKFRYQPSSAISRVLSSCPTCSTSKRLAFGAVKKVKANGGSILKDVCVNSANLSSTLEKLYMWEKKLYMQVKKEERLRIIYDKEWKRLKKLDERGAESSKIDATNDSVKRLLPNIKVAVSTVDTIARRIHKSRDEELQPQLNELIHRLVGMWKFMAECHRKQFRAIMEARTDVQITKEGIDGNSSVKATQKLEMDILNWAKGFTDWLNTQKAFVKFLNGWLMKCLLQEPEETPDGIAPFSPRRLGAPPIFIIVNEWLHAIENFSGTDVLKAMHDFASFLHQLGDKLVEERNQRLKVEYLSKDLEKQVKTLHEESGIKWDEFILSNNSADPEGITENAVLIPGGVFVKFETMTNRLNEEKEKHAEAIKQVDDAASQGFRAGLISIFEALDLFSLEMLKAYEQVRIRSGEVQCEV